MEGGRGNRIPPCCTHLGRSHTAIASFLAASGIYCSGYDAQLNARSGFPVFSTHIEANWVSGQGLARLDCRPESYGWRSHGSHCYMVFVRSSVYEP